MAKPDSEPEPNLDFESISQLIPPSKEGDRMAREQLLVQMQDYVDLMAAKYMDRGLQNKLGPSDIVQQTLTQVVENFDQFRGTTGAEFRGWLKTIVVNEMAKIRRTFHADKRDVHREKQMYLQNEGGRIDFSPVDTNPTPSSDAIAEERIENFHKIMGKLPEDYAEVIRLRSMEQLSFKQIAERMARSHDSVTKLWYRAILKFEELLNDDHGFNSGA